MSDGATEPIKFDGRVAVITGAGNGLGRDYALKLAARGASVLVNDLGGAPTGTGDGSRAAADAVVSEIRAAGGSAAPSYDSVATRDGGEAIIDAALRAFGRVDIVVHNAGIMRTALFANLREADLQALLATHLLGGIYVTQPAFHEMKKNAYGRIIYVSSNGGAFGISGYSAYGAAKSGLIGLMNTVALEGQAHGILANALLPGAMTRLVAAAGESAGTSEGATSEGGTPNEDDLRMGEAFPYLEKAMSPEFVTPMVLYLASERCTDTHTIFSAVGGRYSRAFLGLTQGWLGPDESPATVEEIIRHIETIRDTSDFSIPRSVADELVTVGDARKAERQGGTASSLR